MADEPMLDTALWVAAIHSFIVALVLIFVTG
jgi:hypothetical protein